MARRPHRRTRRVLILIMMAMACLIVVAVAMRRPSHDRNWEFGYERLPSVSVTDGIVTVRNLRDNRVSLGGGVEPGLVDRSFRLDDIERAWFLIEPFQALPISGFEGVAHTYFAFDVAGQSPVTVSVEARREHGEPFSMARGLVNQYELIYVWATEEDGTVRRVIDERHDVYMYPLLIPRETTVALLLRLAANTASIEREPRFYNSLTNNCTSELATAANEVKAGAVPLHFSWWVPGYAVDQLYDLGYIPHDRPLAEIRERYRVTELIRDAFPQPGLSERLRASLRDRPGSPAPARPIIST